MKRFLLSIPLIMIAMASFGQAFWELSFDDTTSLERILIDTISHPDNIWMVGRPSKTIFNSSVSNPNAIVTDTLNSYPVNDTSSFTIIHFAGIGWQTNYPKIDIGGWYYVNSDSLTDFGYIEFSPDMGNTWFSLENPENSGCCSWEAYQELPVLTGNSYGWKHFYYCLCTTTPVEYNDTILYRFTFISDGIQTNKDGLMFDDLHFEDWAEGIDEVLNNNLISVFPNPVSDKLSIFRNNRSNPAEIQIISSLGQAVYYNQNFTLDYIETKNMVNGIYFLKYSDKKSFSIKKIVVKH